MLTLNCQLHIALNFYLKCLNHSHRKICLKELEKSSKVLKPLKKASIWAMSYYVPVYFFYKFVKFNVCLNSKIAQGRSKAQLLALLNVFGIFDLFWAWPKAQGKFFTKKSFKWENFYCLKVFSLCKSKTIFKLLNIYA